MQLFCSDYYIKLKGNIIHWADPICEVNKWVRMIIAKKYLCIEFKMHRESTEHAIFSICIKQS